MKETKPKRWTLEELRARLASWHGRHTFGQPGCPACEGADLFLAHLEEQG